MLSSSMFGHANPLTLFLATHPRFSSQAHIRQPFLPLKIQELARPIALSPSSSPSLSPLFATHPKNALVSPLVATHFQKKMLYPIRLPVRCRPPTPTHHSPLVLVQCA